MTTGANHDRITLVSAGFTSAVVAAATQDLTTVVLIATGYITGGYVFSPDFDCYPAVCRPLKRWGVLKHIWWPYRRLVPHRHWVSHSYVLGVTIQLVYFVGFLILVYQLGHLISGGAIPAFQDITQEVWGVLARFQVQLFCFWVGCCLGQASHLLADGIFPIPRRKKRKRRS